MTEAIIRMPEIARADSHAVFVSHWYAGEGAADAVAGLVGRTRGASWPDGVLASSVYTSADGATVLVYTQSTDAAAYPSAARSWALPGAVEHRLHRSLVFDATPERKEAMVIASFDVDGRERQEAIVDAVCANLLRSPAEDRVGLVACHFHLSADGTRVINYAEWTTDEAHETFLEGATRHGSLRITLDMPGVRPIGFTRYHLRDTVAGTM